MISSERYSSKDSTADNKNDEQINERAVPHAEHCSTRKKFSLSLSLSLSLFLSVCVTHCVASRIRLFVKRAFYFRRHRRIFLSIALFLLDFFCHFLSLSLSLSLLSVSRSPSSFLSPAIVCLHLDAPRWRKARGYENATEIIIAARGIPRFREKDRSTAYFLKPRQHQWLPRRAVLCRSTSRGKRAPSCAPQRTSGKSNRIPSRDIGIIRDPCWGQKRNEVPADEDDAQLIEYAMAIIGYKPPDRPEDGRDKEKKLRKGNLISPLSPPPPPKHRLFRPNSSAAAIW